DTNGILYVADAYNCTIREVAPSGTNWVVTTIAGTATNIDGMVPNYGSADGTNGAAQFFGPSSIAVGRSGNLFVADTYNYTIRKIAPAGTNWVVSTIAGQVGSYGFTDGPNLAAQFNYSYGIASDRSGNLYVADTDNYTIRKIAPSGTSWVVSTLAGVAGITGGNDGTGTNALFSYPYAVAVDGAGHLFVGDTVNGTIRMGWIAAIPHLKVVLTATNSVVVSWPSLGGYTLQSNPDLTTTNWSGYGGAVTTINGTNSVTISPPSGKLFFRLTN
ncbi:MAG TPA: hypothetical protein VIK35_01620, partial [Verrucomicrobiae bacterium]